MKNNINRRNFLKSTTMAGMGLSLPGNKLFSEENLFQKTSSIGIIGLDTSHSIAFTKAINNPEGKAEFSGFKVTAAYPQGSSDIESSIKRIPEYTAEIKKMGVEIVDSIDALLSKVDLILLETNDGKVHLEQALPVLKARKRMFIDKPIAASLKDTLAIFDASKKYNTPVFSSSSLRYEKAIQDILKTNKIGEIKGVDAYSPATLEKTHPDLFWYGIHGVEILFTLLGAGCHSVVRVHNEGTDVVVGTWDNDTIGTFRGMREGKTGYGGTAYGTEGIENFSYASGYEPLVAEILQFFRTGKPPVSPEETIAIYAFMEAADESKRQGGIPVKLETVLAKA
ncbi:Gfo/Idh/MocA family oxidoreductase [soil metagenome]